MMVGDDVVISDKRAKWFKQRKFTYSKQYFKKRIKKQLKYFYYRNDN